MKRTIFIALLFLLLLPATIGQAQGEVTAVESLFIDFWPDYDRPSVLVLLSGTLPEGTSLPASVTIPLPVDAQVNAIAYIDQNGNMMNAESNTGSGEVTIVTPALNFRVEYYFPYTAVGGQHSFGYTWLSNLPVNEFQAKIQQPTAAIGLVSEPAAVNVIEGDDGFAYHVLPPQIVPAGQPLAINVNYNMTSAQLSQDSDITIDLQPAGPAPATTPVPAQEFNWPLIAGVVGGVFVIAALAFLYMGNRPKGRVRKPSPVRQSKPAPKGGARFCHNCGEALEAGDRFCRQCGAPVKSR